MKKTSEYLRTTEVKPIKPVWFMESKTPRNKVEEVRYVMPKIDEEKFVELYNSGTSIEKIKEQFALSPTSVYYFLGKLGLEPRLKMGGNRTRVSSKGVIGVPKFICDKLELEVGAIYEFTLIDSSNNTIKLQKAE